MQRAEYILVRFGELSTKGKNRNEFIAKLFQNLKKSCEEFDGLTFEKTHDRLFIHLNGCDQEAVMARASKVFGISSLSFAYKVNSVLDEICAKALELVSTMSDKHTFKVKAHRQNKQFQPNSDGINRAVATVILQNSELKVDVHHPDILINVEVSSPYTYIMVDKYPGAGGYPVGVAGKGLVLLSGGIDSPVCSYLAMKRGVFLEAIHFAAPPYTSEGALDKVKTLATSLSHYQGYMRLHIVPFTDLQLAIYKNVNESYCITLMRRMMFRIAKQIASKRRCKIIVTGESIGQVASQTLDSMQCINAVVDMPVIRPCACMDKLEIIDIAKKIDTYETSILPYEDCCTIFTPKNPVTRPSIEKCEYYESRFEWEGLLQQAIETTESVVLPLKSETEDLF